MAAARIQAASGVSDGATAEGKKVRSQGCPQGRLRLKQNLIEKSVQIFFRDAVSTF